MPALRPTQEYSNGKLFLYGGLDANNKPFNDAWLFDVQTSSWECVYNGHRCGSALYLCPNAPARQL